MARSERGAASEPPTDERAHVDPARAQLVLHLAAGAQRVDRGREARRVEQGENLLQMALRSAGPEQRREVRDPHRHAARPRTDAAVVPRVGARTGSPSVSTYCRIVITRPSKT